MSFNNIFSKVINGAITFTGNTLGLSKATNSQNAGTSDSIGAFISTNSNVQVSTYPTPSNSIPAGTTSGIISNSSSAELNIPSESTVLYAQLIWGGSYHVIGQDHSNLLKNPINFTTPTNPNHIFEIYPSTQNLFTGENSSFYSNSANVTNYVAEGLSGTYTAGNIVGTTSPTDNNNNCCGWTLAVVYQNSLLPFQNLSLFVGGEFISPSSPLVLPLNIPNFETPATSGNVSGRILLSALKGNADKTGDQVLFGSSSNSLTSLSGPKNPVTNFFGSQINNDLGETNTLGSFGNRNQDVINSQNIVAGRQGLDITSVDATTALLPSQNSAVIKFMTTDDTFIPNAFAVETSINAPNLVITKTSSETFIIPDFIGSSATSTTTYTITITNNGSNSANNCILTDTIPKGLSFNLGSVQIDSTSNATANIEQGINLGTIAPTAKTIVTFTTTANQFPYDNASYSNSCTLSYSFIALNQTFTGTSQSNKCTIETSAFYLPPLVPDYNETAYKNTPLKGKIMAVSSTSTISNYSLNSTPTNGYVNINSDGAWIYTPKVSFSGIDTFSVLITDANQVSSICTITITVKDVFENDVPLKFPVDHLIFPKGGIKPCR